MKQFTSFAGVDISKGWIDVTTISQDYELSKPIRVNNNPEAIQEFITGLPFYYDELLICMEHMGPYCKPFLSVADSLRLNVWLETPLQIKRSLGMTRGKSDALDSKRIADYARRYQDRVNLWTQDPPVVTELARLQSKRALLVKVRQQLKHSANKPVDEELSSPAIAVGEAVSSVEDKMLLTIMSDEKTSRQYELLCSVPGVGLVVSTAVIVATKGFTRLTLPRKFACYSGIAPFPHSSGTTILYKKSLSKFGNKRLKVILQIAALHAIRSIPALKVYYEKKIAEGKNKFSVHNAVRNKVVAIMLAVVRNDTPYQREYVSSYVKKADTH